MIGFETGQGRSCADLWLVGAKEILIAGQPHGYLLPGTIGYLVCPRQCCQRGRGVRILSRNLGEHAKRKIASLSGLVIFYLSNQRWNSLTLGGLGQGHYCIILPLRNT